MADEIRLKQEIELLKNRLDDYQQLFNILKQLSSNLSMEQILQQLIDEAVKLCFADHGAVTLLAPGKQEIAKTLTSSADPHKATLDSYLLNLLLSRVFENNSHLHTHSLVYTFGEELINENYQDISSVLAVPVGSGQEILAVINLVSYNSNNLFDQREVNLLQILATQCINIISKERRRESNLDNHRGQRKQQQKDQIFKEVIGNSTKLQQVFKLLERIIATAAPVLIEGENGSGKELLARILHQNGPHKDGPFIAVDCAAFPDNLLESELFGYIKDAFSGAETDKAGLFEEAHNGTLFLAEISNIPVNIQSKLLHALQEGEIRPVGSSKVKKVNVRIIAAASDSLRAKMEDGSFRKDLYNYLSTVNIMLPPLQQRKTDILFLAEHFIKKYAKKYNKQLTGLIPDTLNIMENYNWPGNIRELENVIERMVILADDKEKHIKPVLLPENIRQQKIKTPTVKEDASIPEAEPIEKKKADYEKDMIIAALEKNRWNQSAAAQELGIHESTLRYRMRKFAIRKPTFKSGRDSSLRSE